MKHLFLALFMAIIAMPAMATETSHTLKPIEAKYVCMVNDTAFDKEQIAVEVDGKTYFGCCAMCEARLKKDTDIRSAVDPVSGVQVDKAEAVIGADNQGKVYYFESSANLDKYKVAAADNHDHMMDGHEGMMHDKMMHSEHDTSELTEGTGTLNAISDNKVNVTHGPIPALQWPEMTMDLPVSESVDLSGFEKGDSVRFFLKLKDKTYVIEKMKSIDVQSHEDGHDHQH